MKTMAFLWGFLFLAVPVWAKSPPSPHQAAQRIIKTFYQSCDAAAKPPYDIEKNPEMRGYTRLRNEVTHGSNSRVEDLAAARASQYYISCDPKRAKPRKGCRDLCDAPPTYIWGGMGFYEKTKKGLKLDVFRNTEPTQSLAQHPGLDCSGLVHAIFATAGLRVRPDMAPSAETADQLTARTYMKQPGGCFNDVKLNEVRAGDVIAWKTHMMMVDSAGADPFGLAGVASVKDCTFEKLNPDAFEMVVINSKGGTDPLKDETKALLERNPVLKRKWAIVGKNITGVGVGISKVRLSDLAVMAPAAIMDLALAACHAKFGEEKPAWRETINLVRHRLTEPGAVAAKDDPCLARADEQIELVGESCVNRCP